MINNTDFVFKLIRETKNDILTWEIVKHALELPHDEKLTSKIYTLEIKDKKFRLYEYQYKHYVDVDEWLWNQRKRLELIDGDNERLYEFEYDYSFNDLFDIVTKKTSGIDDFLHDFLSN